MRIVHADGAALVARHVPWLYWLTTIGLFVWAHRLWAGSPPRMDEQVFALILTAVGVVMGLRWGKVISLEIDRRRKHVVLKRWGLLGPRVRSFSFKEITAIYMERYVHESKGTKIPQHRIVLLDDAEQIVEITPFSFLEFGYENTASRMYEFLKESRGEFTVASHARLRP